jgi:hypothetical protein
VGGDLGEGEVGEGEGGADRRGREGGQGGGTNIVIKESWPM